jgi:hypothetical protein
MFNNSVIGLTGRYSFIDTGDTSGVKLLAKILLPGLHCKGSRDVLAGIAVAFFNFLLLYPLLKG